MSERSWRRRSPAPLSNRVVLTRIPCRKKGTRIDWLTPSDHLEMQVVSGGAAAGTFVSKRLTSNDVGVVCRRESPQVTV